MVILSCSVCCALHQFLHSAECMTLSVVCYTANRYSLVFLQHSCVHDSTQAVPHETILGSKYVVLLNSELQHFPVHHSKPWGLSVRSLEPGRPKRLYFVSSGVKHLLQNDDREALKVTMTGLKVFERQELKVCAYLHLPLVHNLALLTSHAVLPCVQPAVQSSACPSQLQTTHHLTRLAGVLLLIGLLTLLSVVVRQKVK